MDLAIIAAKQVLEMFLMILAGFICFKTGVIKEEGKKALSAFVSCSSGNDCKFVSCRT